MTTIDDLLKIPNNEVAIKQQLQCYLEKEDIFQTRHCIERILLKIGSQQHEQTITITSLINFIEEFQLSNEFAIDIYTKIITTATTIVLQIPNDIYTTLLFHLIQTKHYHILTQLLQYHIIPDTKEIAMQLINSEKENKNLYYIGLDILKRKKNYSLLVEVYLSRGDVLMALQIASQHKIDVLPQKLRASLDLTHNPLLESQVLQIYPDISVSNTTHP